METCNMETNESLERVSSLEQCFSRGSVDSNDSNPDNALSDIEEDDSCFAPTVGQPRRKLSLFMGFPASASFPLVKTVTTRRKCQSECLDADRTVVQDPWDTFYENINAQSATRYRFNVKQRVWVNDTILIKLDTVTFDRGAMRSCLRMKKLRNGESWTLADNYVAKKYIEPVERGVYFEDVRLQMEAKMWADSYNRKNPPKLVDMNQICVFELQSGQLFHMEYYMPGCYVKYNSNSGFVDEQCRFTPHAFTHFTFESSGHEMMVVDIQGVGDLYTDPQIHTATGEGYGDGNLGTRGMALFFHSHLCNPVCEFLGLSKFDLSDSELDELRTLHPDSPVIAATAVTNRPRSGSFSASSGDSEHRNEENNSQIKDRISTSASKSSSSTGPNSESRFVAFSNLRRRHRGDSESSIEFSGGSSENILELLPSSVQLTHETNADIDVCDGTVSRSKVLGEIHMQLAKCHDLRRFAQTSTIDIQSAIFHLELSAELRNSTAAKTLALICLQKECSMLASVKLPESNEKKNKGVDYMIQAAEDGDRSAMIFMAHAFETGFGLGSARQVDWQEAARFYEQALNGAQTSEDTASDSFDACMDEPVYKLTASLARLYHEGLHGLDKDASQAGDLYNEAADTAMSKFKGKLANKYFELAEVAWAEVEEE